MRTVIVTQGLPASGKSTWAKQLQAREPGRWKRINRDDLREMLDDSAYSKSNETFVKETMFDMLRSALKSGYDVILDNTQLHRQVLKRINVVCESVGDVKVIVKAFNVPVEECIRRNEARGGKVPNEAIYRMARSSGIAKGKKLKDSERYYEPHGTGVPVIQDKGKDKSIVCDLDGTLADISWRNPYDASRCDEDGLNEHVAELVKAMHAAGRRIIFVSGRVDTYKPQTVKFIEKHLPGLPYDLHMRQAGDMRKDTVIKREIFHKLIEPDSYVEFVVDDRPCVVRMWRYDLGIPVMQVNDKEF